MILFPNAKINIGLDIVQKREDGYHNLESVFYPIQLCDILEINKSETFNFSQSGIEIGGNWEDNIVVKAFRLLQSDFNFPNVNIHLHKQIPYGAGLGGGSSDAAFTLKGLNELFSLNMLNDRLLEYAAQLGSDCPFFIENRAVFAEGRGDILRPINLCLKGLTLVLIKPECNVSTVEAYANIKPKRSDEKLFDLIGTPILNWKTKIRNGFEESIFHKYPEIEAVKNELYKMGAVYASMSGSGSSVFALFESELNELKKSFDNYFIYKEHIQ